MFADGADHVVALGMDEVADTGDAVGIETEVLFVSISVGADAQGGGDGVHVYAQAPAAAEVEHQRVAAFSIHSRSRLSGSIFFQSPSGWY